MLSICKQSTLKYIRINKIVSLTQMQSKVKTIGSFEQVMYKIDMISYFKYTLVIMRIKHEKYSHWWSVTLILIYCNAQGFSKVLVCSRCLMGSLIELIQVVSTSEFHEYWWNDFGFIFFVPLTCCRDSEASKIDYFKN